MIAALYVRSDGPYAGRQEIDAWPKERDATLYDGPYPVVAHPPCARWGRFWKADGSTVPGNDGGLFESALHAVRRWGGVIEHPEASHAFARFDLGRPCRGSWQRNLWGDWVTEVSQCQYGHRARKATWLLAHGVSELPELDWRLGKGEVYLAQCGRCSKEKPRPTCGCDRCRKLFGTPPRPTERMSARENELTPPDFAELLVGIARRAKSLTV